MTTHTTIPGPSRARRSRIVLALAVVAGLIAGPAAATAGAAEQNSARPVASGTTELVLSAVELAQAGIGQDAIRPALLTPRGDSVVFPIRRGTYDGTGPTYSGHIRNIGRLVLESTDARLVLAAPAVNLTAGTVTAIVGGVRVPVLTLDPNALINELPQDPSSPFASVILAGIPITFTAQAADAINDTFGTELDEGAAAGVVRLRLLF